jgi:hypothetical protein
VIGPPDIEPRFGLLANPPSPINNIIPARNNPVADEQLARMRTLSSVQSSGPW